MKYHDVAPVCQRRSVSRCVGGAGGPRLYRSPAGWRKFGPGDVAAGGAGGSDGGGARGGRSQGQGGAGKRGGGGGPRGGGRERGGAPLTRGEGGPALGGLARASPFGQTPPSPRGAAAPS